MDKLEIEFERLKSLDDDDLVIVVQNYIDGFGVEEVAFMNNLPTYISFLSNKYPKEDQVEILDRIFRNPQFHPEDKYFDWRFDTNTLRSANSVRELIGEDLLDEILLNVAKINVEQQF